MTFPKAGDYRVAVHDSKFSDQVQNFYRLKIAKFEYADTCSRSAVPRAPKSLFPAAIWRKPG